MLLIKPLHRGLLVDHRHHDLAVFRHRGALHHHNVAVLNMGADHTVTSHMEGKQLLPRPSAEHRNILLNMLGSKNGHTGSHRAQQRHLGHLGRTAGQSNGALAVGVPLNAAHTLQFVQIVLHGGGGAEPHGVTDLPHGGRHAPLVQGALNIAQNLLLHPADSFHVRDLPSVRFFLFYIKNSIAFGPCLVKQMC